VSNHSDWSQNLNAILICISFIAKDNEHFFIIYWSFVLLLLRIVCSVHSVGCWFFERLVFWALCIFWLLIPCQTYSWQRFFSPSIGCLFTLVTVSLLGSNFLVSCSPTCKSFLLIAELLEL
jgi:hypothetical protein